MQQIKFSSMVPRDRWALVEIWYEKLPKKWAIWQKYKVKSPIIPTYPCTGVVGLTIDKYIICIYRK